MFFINPLSAILLIVFAAFTGCYYVYVRNRLEFAGAILEIACSSIRRYPTSIMVAFGSLLVQLIVVIIWALAYYGAVASTIAFGSFVLETYLLFSLFSFSGSRFLQASVESTLSEVFCCFWIIFPILTLQSSPDLSYVKFVLNSLY